MNHKVFKYPLFCLAVLICGLLSGCGILVPNITSDKVDMGKTLDNDIVKVIIDDADLKYDETGRKLIENIHELFSKKFKQTTIESNYQGIMAYDCLYIKPVSAKFNITAKHKTMETKATIKTDIQIRYGQQYEEMSFKATGTYKSSLVENLVGLAVEIGTLGLSVKGQAAIYEKIAKHNATQALSSKVFNGIIDSQLFNPLIAAINISHSLPSDLFVTAKFSDTSGLQPNATIDAAEEGEIVVAITNNGKGVGYGTVLDITSDNPKINIGKQINIGDIQPNGTKEVIVPFKASLDIGDGRASFQFSLKEKRGYDAKKVVLFVPTAKLERPNLVIVGIEINDSDTGLAKGNGNSIPESGETIELTVFIKNEGVGKAIGVNLEGMDISVGIQWVRGSTLVGTIQPGETAKTKLAFSIPRNFEGKYIAANLKVADVRGVSDMAKGISYPVLAKGPKLRYESSVASRHGGDTLEQGEQAVLEIAVYNDGNLQAEAVSLRVATKDDNLMIQGAKEILIGNIPSNARSETIKFQLSTRRSIKIGEAPLAVHIGQKDFPAINTQYVLNIAEEDATVIDVASENKGKGATRIRTGSGPSIALISAPGALETSEETFRLAFDVKDTRNIDQINVTVNGIRHLLTERDGMTRKASKNKQIIRAVPLSGGENRIIITAYNVANISSRKELIVRRATETDVDTPLVTGHNNPDAIGLVIGISRYESPDIPPVDYAVKDAAKVRDYLVKTMGFRENNIMSYYDEKATNTKLKTAIRVDLKNRTNTASDVFIYFSGHGTQEPSEKEPYLATYDLDSKNLRDTALSLKDLYGQIEILSPKVRSITVLIDACFSGMTDSSSGNTVTLIKGASAIFMEINNPLLKAKNTTVFTASSKNETANWYPEKQHGIFTYYFLRGLQGKADIDNNGIITARKMENWLLKTVPVEAMKQRNRYQTPQVTASNKDAVLLKLR